MALETRALESRVLYMMLILEVVDIWVYHRRILLGGFSVQDRPLQYYRNFSRREHNIAGKKSDYGVNEIHQNIIISILIEAYLKILKSV